MLTFQPGEEKKSLAPLLAKLHVSPASTHSLLKEVYNEVSIAVEDKLVSDATGRNALFKIHVSLGKIANTLKDEEAGNDTLRASTTSRGSRKSSSAPSVEIEREESVIEEEEKTVLGEVKERIEKAEEDEEDEGTVVGNKTEVERDSLVEALLDDDIEMSGM